jgi:hypothetical protein
LDWDRADDCCVFIGHFSDQKVQPDKPSDLLWQEQQVAVHELRCSPTQRRSAHNFGRERSQNVSPDFHHLEFDIQARIFIEASQLLIMSFQDLLPIQVVREPATTQEKTDDHDH